jgi:hypothetical protein
MYSTLIACFAAIYAGIRRKNAVNHIPYQPSENIRKQNSQYHGCDIGCYYSYRLVNQRGPAGLIW